MNRLIQEIELASEELTPEWTPERSMRLLHGAQQLGHRRAVTRVRRGAALAIAAAVLLGVFEWRHTSAPEATVAERDVHGVQAAGGAASDDAERSGHRLRLADGSRAELVGAQSELEVVHNSKDRVGLSLVSGRAHFEVVHDPMRSFVVEARPYRVEVIGTVFDVERKADEVGVSVTRGKVRVYGPQGAEDVVAGQIKHWPAVQAPPAATDPKAGDDAADDEADEPSAPEEHTGRARARAAKRGGTNSGPRADASWRSLSQSGQYDAAFEALRQAQDVDNDPAALMDAADAARLSGHAQNAVQYLAQVVSEHRKSPVAPLAAFTLGRVYLDKLGQPDKAAEAFEAARALSPNGSLAQDALAREVEALSKGGNAQKAYVRAQEYLKKYPNGRRSRAVQLYGGVE
jgi:transmembrane sensor